MTIQRIETVKKTWTILSRLDQQTVGQLFYSRLFEIAPHLQPLFKTSVHEQSAKLIPMLAYARLGRCHGNYSVRDVNYTWVGRAPLWTLEQGLGNHWNEAVKDAWTTCYTLLAESMIDAANTETKAA